MANDRTIEQFGEQWDRFSDTEGAFGSVAVLEDICGPLLPVREIEGRRVLEVGSGNGRIVKMFIQAGASHVTAVEPSAGIDTLKKNTVEHADHIDYLQVRGDQLPAVDADLAFCIGVLHHLEDPVPTVKRIHASLPGGARFLIWVYGREGNTLYIVFAETLRIITRVCPDWLLSAIAHVLNFVLGFYVQVCRVLPLPLGRYMREVMSKFDRRKRYFLIFDQLNCDYAKYYTGDEVRELMESGGFRAIETYHRHGMSWTAIGRKTEETEGRPC